MGLIMMAKEKFGISPNVYRSLWYNGKPMGPKPVMKMIPRADDRPDRPPVLSLSPRVPDNFQDVSDEESADTVTTSDVLLSTVESRITNKKKQNAKPASANKSISDRERKPTTNRNNRKSPEGTLKPKDTRSDEETTDPSSTSRST